MVAASSSTPTPPPLLERCTHFNPVSLQTEEGRLNWSALMDEAAQTDGGNARNAERILLRIFTDIRIPLDLIKKGTQIRRGEFNQAKGDKGSNACTFCAQIFLIHVFKAWGFWDMSSKEIELIVDRGRLAYERCQQQIRTDNKVKDEKGHEIVFWASEETEPILGLTQLDPGIWPEVTKHQMLYSEESWDGIEHFKSFLSSLEQVAIKVGHFGAVLTYNKKTIALAVFNRGEHFEFGLFDSHGNEKVTPGHNGAFVLCSADREEMAEELSKLFDKLPPELPPYRSQMDISLVQLKEEVVLPDVESCYKVHCCAVTLLALTAAICIQNRSYLLNCVTRGQAALREFRLGKTPLPGQG